ncbi:hypothetical protein D9M72_633440 [compost metagenome]
MAVITCTRAFPRRKGTTASTEGTTCHLGNPWVADAIAKEHQALQKRTQVTVDRVVQALVCW